jgi:hypothetical protein
MEQNIIQTIFLYLSQINYLYILIGFFFIFYATYIFLISYHLTRFGIGVKPKVASFIFTWGSLILMIGVAAAFQQVNFQEILNFWQQSDLFKIPLL